MPQFNEKKHILLLDDDEDDFFILKEVTKTYFSSLTVSYGFGCEFTDKAIFDCVDLVLLDINMPRFSGFECLDVIRRQYGLAKLPIIMYSNSFATRDARNAYQLGANLFVNKPVSFETIKLFIKDILSIDWTKIEEITKENASSTKVLKYW